MKPVAQPLLSAHGAMLMPLFFKKYSKYQSEYPTATAFFEA